MLLNISTILFPFKPYAGYGICRHCVIEIFRKAVNREFFHNAIFFCTENIIVCKAVACDLMNGCC